MTHAIVIEKFIKRFLDPFRIVSKGLDPYSEEEAAFKDGVNDLVKYLKYISSLIAKMMKTRKYFFFKKRISESELNTLLFSLKKLSDKFYELMELRAKLILHYGFPEDKRRRLYKFHENIAKICWDNIKEIILDLKKQNLNEIRGSLANIKFLIESKVFNTKMWDRYFPVLSFNFFGYGSWDKYEYLLLLKPTIKR